MTLLEKTRQTLGVGPHRPKNPCKCGHARDAHTADGCAVSWPVRNSEGVDFDGCGCERYRRKVRAKVATEAQKVTP